MPDHSVEPEDSATQTPVHIAASFIVGRCALRWNPKRSIASRQSTPALKAIQDQKSAFINSSNKYKLASLADGVVDTLAQAQMRSPDQASQYCREATFLS